MLISSPCCQFNLKIQELEVKHTLKVGRVREGIWAKKACRGREKGNGREDICLGVMVYIIVILIINIHLIISYTYMIAFVDILFAAQSYFSPYGVFDVEQLAFERGPFRTPNPKNIPKNPWCTKIVHTSGTFFENVRKQLETIC